jgi:hypothetical protein
VLSGIGMAVSAVALFCVSAIAPVSANDQRAETASKTPYIYGTAWGATLAQDGSGFYNEIIGDVLAQLEVKPDYHLRPYKRAKVSFFAEENSCLYPSSLSALASAGQIKDPADFIESDGLFTARTHLFVRAGETPPASLDDVFGKSIAYPNGSVVRSVLEGRGARLISVNDEGDKADMLTSGRVDIISGMIPDTALVFGDREGALPQYDPSLVLLEVDVTFVCHRSPANNQLIASINDALDRLSADSEYRARMAEAKVALDVLARGSGGETDLSEEDLNNLMPAAGQLSKKKRLKARSGRRVAARAHR